nr:site-specific DNA-methyltransferase [Evansella tamaricis]
MLFPNVITEMKDENGNLKKGINFELLKQELSDDVIDGDENYDFTWVGKKASIVEGNTPIRKTLRPCVEESKAWEKTENVFIEGDNLEVLKLLQESYLNSIKLIYIDPPYNTGKDFVYKDNFTMDKEEFDEKIGTHDEEENRLFRNTQTNGRFHSDWCSMIYPRLKLAQNLLREDGVIFISIDDHEADNLKKICHEIFGESNYICDFIRKGSGGRQDSKHYAIVHEYILCYTKNMNYFVSGKELKEDDSYPHFDSEKELHYKTQLLRKWGENSRRSDRPNLYYAIKDPDGNDLYPMLSATEAGCWRWGRDRMTAEIAAGNVEFKKKDDEWIPYEKIYEPTKDNPKTKLYTTVLENIGNASGAPLLKELLDGKIFSYPKPVELIKKVIELGNVGPDDIVLDFFAGSATTAHAVMDLNSVDGGSRKYIMVQIPEEVEEKSDAYQAGYKTITEIGKERIRRAGEKIKGDVMEFNEQKKEEDDPRVVPDIGFRVLKVDSTNMKDVYYSATEYTQDLLERVESNIKEDRSDLDLLYGVLVDWGLPLSLSLELEEIEGVRVHTIDEGSLIACFDENVSENVVREIAKRQPLRVVFRDSSFKNSPDKINVGEIFKLLAPNTTVKVI